MPLFGRMVFHTLSQRTTRTTLRQNCAYHEPHGVTRSIHACKMSDYIISWLTMHPSEKKKNLTIPDNSLETMTWTKAKMPHSDAQDRGGLGLRIRRDFFHLILMKKVFVCRKFPSSYIKFMWSCVNAKYSLNIPFSILLWLTPDDVTLHWENYG